MRYLSALIAFAFILSSCSPAADPVVIEKLEQIIEVRERMVEETVLLFPLGKTNPANSLIALSEAKIALATEQNDFPAIIAEREKLVKRLNEFSDRLQALAEEDRKTRTEISEMRVHVIEAEIQLHRAKIKYGLK